MGNEKSALKGLDIDEKAIEVTDFWMHYGATIHDSNPHRVSIFISEPALHYSASFGKPSPLEEAAKNLMLHRHPCILKYIATWRKGNKFFLATEEVKPLVHVLETQTTIQICLGLHCILRGLTFLHENASASHNNISSSSIYVTSEGKWKLGGLEYLCKFTKMTPTYFQKIKSYRYEKAISPNEDILALTTSGQPTAIDEYAFGVFAEEILKLKKSDDVPGLTEFRRLCTENLQNNDPYARSKLSIVLQHTFFTHDFMKIYAFLEELPLKNELEKEEFFTNLVQQLKSFPETVIAEQLGRLLLSRIVLLDNTAQMKLLPSILIPKDENNDESSGLFTIATFKTFIVPQLLQLFCIRDASIRLLLLSYFKFFVRVFQVNELQYELLPELLVGIKDTDDRVVSETLRALADVVPILGAAIVIGGNRGKLFSDGRPNKTKEHEEIEARITSSGEFTELHKIPNIHINLLERPSPDGGEDKMESAVINTEEDSTWSDWDAHEVNADNQCEPNIVEDISETSQVQKLDSKATVNLVKSDTITETVFNKKMVIDDITELDIKHSKTVKGTNEFDYFTDMEPVIKKTQVVHIQAESLAKSMFDVENVSSTMEEEGENNGWSEDFSEWDIDDTHEIDT